jgi:hypothetical protein
MQFVADTRHVRPPDNLCESGGLGRSECARSWSSSTTCACCSGGAFAAKRGDGENDGSGIQVAIVTSFLRTAEWSASILGQDLERDEWSLKQPMCQGRGLNPRQRESAPWGVIQRKVQ